MIHVFIHGENEKTSVSFLSFIKLLFNIKVNKNWRHNNCSQSLYWHWNWNKVKFKKHYLFEYVVYKSSNCSINTIN